MKRLLALVLLLVLWNAGLSYMTWQLWILPAPVPVVVAAPVVPTPVSRAQPVTPVLCTDALQRRQQTQAQMGEPSRLLLELLSQAEQDVARYCR